VSVAAAATLHRDLIITLAARHKLPAVYFGRHFVARGGLISHRPVLTGRQLHRSHPQEREAADLPVQAPTN
jgi:putative tryptophan/tyrosine transport system substrate-binding protein